MSDFLDRLGRRLQRKQSEEPALAPAEEARVGTAESPPSPAMPRPIIPVSQAVKAISQQPGDEEKEDIALVFAPGGPVAHLLGDSYRPRQGQARMARLVMDAL
jgi:hypothetical protein